MGISYQGYVEVQVAPRRIVHICAGVDMLAVPFDLQQARLIRHINQELAPDGAIPPLGKRHDSLQDSQVQK